MCAKYIPQEDISEEDIPDENNQLKEISLGSKSPIDQTQWSHKHYKNMKKPILYAAQSTMWHALVGKPMHGRIARLFWKLLTRYHRLEKIEKCLGEKVDLAVKHECEDAWKKIENEKNPRYRKEDQLLSDWLYVRTMDPACRWFNRATDYVYRRFFPPAPNPAA